MSLANATGTRIETGTRHMQQCRVCTDVLTACAADKNDLIQNPKKWCVHKDELAVSCAKPILPDDVPKTSNKYAYPPMISCLNLQSLNDASKDQIARGLRLYYATVGIADKTALEAMLTAITTQENAKKALRTFTPIGYSVGEAQPEPSLGDTMSSIQIGGLRTVMNGRFPIETGDLVQVYIEGVENQCFRDDGGRIYPTDCAQLVTDFTAAGVTAAGVTQPIWDTFSNANFGTGLNVAGSANFEKHSADALRKDYYDRGYGMDKDTAKRNIFAIKPYIESLNDQNVVYPGDKMRVFAKAISSARPYEPVDIMIARQSL